MAGCRGRFRGMTVLAGKPGHRVRGDSVKRLHADFIQEPEKNPAVSFDPFSASGRNMRLDEIVDEDPDPVRKRPVGVAIPRILENRRFAGSVDLVEDSQRMECIAGPRCTAVQQRGSGKQARHAGA